MEELVLTDPVVVPEKVTSTYKVRMLTLNWDAQHTPANEPGIVYIELVDNHGERLTHRYVGDEALDLMKWMNTANFSTQSMHKRILQKLSNDGILPGTVTGAPDPSAPVLRQKIRKKE